MLTAVIPIAQVDITWTIVIGPLGVIWFAFVLFLEHKKSASNSLFSGNLAELLACIFTSKNMLDVMGIDCIIRIATNSVERIGLAQILPCPLYLIIRLVILHLIVEQVYESHGCEEVWEGDDKLHGQLLELFVLKSSFLKYLLEEKGIEKAHIGVEEIGEQQYNYPCDNETIEVTQGVVDLEHFVLLQLEEIQE